MSEEKPRIRNCVTHHICDCNYEKMKSLEKEIERLKEDIKKSDRFHEIKNCQIKGYYQREEKLKLENTVLKEKLSVAESQIEDLKSQLSYFENGEGN